MAETLRDILKKIDELGLEKIEAKIQDLTDQIQGLTKSIEQGGSSGQQGGSSGQQGGSSKDIYIKNKIAEMGVRAQMDANAIAQEKLTDIKDLEKKYDKELENMDKRIKDIEDDVKDILPKSEKDETDNILQTLASDKARAL